MTDTLAAPAATVARDRYGRPLVIPPGGGKPVAYRRCTKFIEVLDDRYQLERWKQRQVAAGMALRPDLVLKAASADGDRTLLEQVVDAASEAAGSTTARTAGTAVHALTEQLDRGQQPTIPPATQPDIDAYRAATVELAVEELEVFVVDDTLKVGGTFDRIVSHGGRRYVADIKTGKVDYAAPEILMQLAIYAGSSRYHPTDGAREPLDVDTEWGLVIHLPAGAGECTIWWANLAIGRQGVEVARHVWGWRDARHRFGRQFLPLLEQIQTAGSVPTLEHLWQRHVAVWTDVHTDAAVARKKELLAQSA